MNLLLLILIGIPHIITSKCIAKDDNNLNDIDICSMIDNVRTKSLVQIRGICDKRTECGWVRPPHYGYQDVIIEITDAVYATPREICMTDYGESLFIKECEPLLKDARLTHVYDQGIEWLNHDITNNEKWEEAKRKCKTEWFSSEFESSKCPDDFRQNVLALICDKLFEFNNEIPFGDRLNAIKTDETIHIGPKIDIRPSGVSRRIEPAEIIKIRNWFRSELHNLHKQGGQYEFDSMRTPVGRANIISELESRAMSDNNPDKPDLVHFNEVIRHIIPYIFYGINQRITADFQPWLFQRFNYNFKTIKAIFEGVSKTKAERMGMLQSLQSNLKQTKPKQKKPPKPGGAGAVTINTGEIDVDPQRKQWVDEFINDAMKLTSSTEPSAAGFVESYNFKPLCGRNVYDEGFIECMALRLYSIIPTAPMRHTYRCNAVKDKHCAEEQYQYVLYAQVLQEAFKINTKKVLQIYKLGQHIDVDYWTKPHVHGIHYGALGILYHGVKDKCVDFRMLLGRDRNMRLSFNGMLSTSTNKDSATNFAGGRIGFVLTLKLDPRSRPHPILMQMISAMPDEKEVLLYGMRNIQVLSPIEYLPNEREYFAACGLNNERTVKMMKSPRAFLCPPPSEPQGHLPQSQTPFTFKDVMDVSSANIGDYNDYYVYEGYDHDNDEQEVIGSGLGNEYNNNVFTLEIGLIFVMMIFVCLIILIALLCSCSLGAFAGWYANKLQKKTERDINV